MSAILIAPSVLAADFGHLGAQVKEAEAGGADWLHIDIMDGHFVPAISFGPVVLAAIKKNTSLPLDIHLMVQAPEQQLPQFAPYRPELITVHIETCLHIHRTLQLIKEMGIKAGVALNPGTPVTAVDEVLPYLDLVLVMSVNPGASGQTFIPTMLDKISRLRRSIDAGKSHCLLAVDGGINKSTAAAAVRAGARMLVAGAAVFNPARPVKEAIAELRASGGTDC